VTDDQDRAPALLRPITKKPLTPRRAAFIIAAFTVGFTVAGGVIAWALDREDFPSIGEGLWWALQTVTTVGYGDVVPENPQGRALAALVMLVGIAFVAVVTAAVTAALIESARRRMRGSQDAELAEISRRLAAIEAALGIAEAERD
jgi:voltage-gated potassium channel